VKKGILRMLGVVVTLALMLTILPASIASAAYSTKVVNITTASDYYGEARGAVGDRVEIIGTDGSVDTYLSVYFSDQEADVNDNIDTDVTRYKVWPEALTVTTGGNFKVTNLEIPNALLDGDEVLSELHGGIYYFYLVKYNHSETGPGTPTTKILAVVEFEIAGIADVNIDKTTGPVGTVVNVNGSGFAPSEYIDIDYYQTSTSFITIDTMVSGSDQVKPDGTFNFSFAIPDSVNGKHKVIFKGEISRASETFEFTVSPSVTLSKGSGQGGDNVIVYAKGFLRSSDVDIFIEGIKLDIDDSATISDKTDTTGSLTYIVTIPAALGSGTYDVLVRDETTSTISATTQFEVILNSAMEISHSSGNVGDKVTVNGTCYAAGTTVTILYDGVSVGTATVDSSGDFTKEITIPESACGSHTIVVGTQDKTFTVEAKISVDKTEGIAGTEVTITGTGFYADTDISLEFDSDDVDIEDGDETTDAKGSFSFSFIVPALTPGDYEIDVTAGAIKSAEFKILDASIELNVASGEVGDAITVSGVNFAANSNITLTIDGVAVTTLPTPVSAGSDGSFSASFIIPTIAGGTHTISVTDGTTTKTENFTVTSSATITPTSGHVGIVVTVNGEGFKASHTITITYNGTALQLDNAITTNAAGVFNATFNVPPSPGGERTVAVSDGTNSVEFIFNMETTAPPAPTLTAPESASKQKGIVTFDWSDVTDASMPVTYNLQVAGDSGFSNIVVNKTGLTASTYTLTEAEELPKLADGGQYYWRVIATDAANNSSTSAVNTFTVGGNLPGWLMWLWIGIGVVVVFIFAIWLGRRMAYSSY